MHKKIYKNKKYGGGGGYLCSMSSRRKSGRLNNKSEYLGHQSSQVEYTDVQVYSRLLADKQIMDYANCKMDRYE